MILADVVESCELGDAGIDGEHVHPSGLSTNSLKEGGERCQIGSIYAARAQRAGPKHALPLIGATTGGVNGGAFRREPLCDSATDSAMTTDHDGDFS
ncbi:hypothetical protein D3C71_1665240 [compost metagenome]